MQTQTIKWQSNNATAHLDFRLCSRVQRADQAERKMFLFNYGRTKTTHPHSLRHRSVVAAAASRQSPIWMMVVGWLGIVYSIERALFWRGRDSRKATKENTNIRLRHWIPGKQQ